ncbi:hypothetical protein [Nocardia colli]|nr:hypothetical protein [Nocardia colli]
MICSRTRPRHIPVAPNALELAGTDLGEMTSGALLPADGGLSTVGMV